MKIKLAILLLVSPCLAEQEFDPNALREFMLKANLFEREYYGCPPKAVHINDCYGQGIFDTKLKKEVWQMGRELFK